MVPWRDAPWPSHAAQGDTYVLPMPGSWLEQCPPVAGCPVAPSVATAAQQDGGDGVGRAIRLLIGAPRRGAARR